LSEAQFKFLEFRRVDFLRRVGYFEEEGTGGRRVGRKEALRGSTSEALRIRRGRHTRCYEATNIDATRDSLYWSWRRVGEYWRDFSDMEDRGERREVVRIDPWVRRR
jgi:hypothetical protein